MNTIVKYLNWFTDKSGRVLAFLIYPGFLLLAYEVFMRYFLNAPSVWSLGLSQRFFAVLYLVSGAYVLMHNGHIRMDLLYNRFPPRVKALLDILITYPLLLLICVIVIRYGGKYALQSIKIMETDSTAFGAPLWPVKLFIPIGGIMLLLQALAKLLLTIRLLITGQEENSGL